MEEKFWAERWEQNKIGFHQNQTNQYLKKFWKKLTKNKPGTLVFVPLCGKSVDMLWLNQMGHHVLGVEISSIAASNFFAENNIQQPEVLQLELFKSWQSEHLTFLEGDYFSLSPSMLSDVIIVYDRAALIALPPKMRRAYVDHQHAILPKGIEQLLVTLEYDAAEMKGPPFSVVEDEVQHYYGPNYEIELLSDLEVLEDNPNLRNRGATEVREKVYYLRSRF